MATTTRKLAAIMFTDIVGYTTLMGSDEDRAIEVLRENREIHTKFTEQFNGTLIKEMGDGMLISFNLASEAVRCAIEIQKACKTENIPLKIGIHEGEMVFEGADVLGDGVNVAARIQDGAGEGCIMISGAVYRDIKNKTGIYAEFVAEKYFKNVDEKIRIYKVNCGEEISNDKKQITSKNQGSKSKKQKAVFGILGLLMIIIIAVLVWLFGRISGPPSPRAAEGKEKSIAVRPFWNESTNEENEAFVNGMTEDIRNALSNIADLRVLSRGSVEKYKDHQFTTSNIADELGVTYVLEGTVQRIEDFVKIHVQLIDPGKNEDHIWQETYEEDLSEINKVFQIQSEIAKSVANALKIFLSDEAKARIEIIPTNDKKAYDLYIRGSYELSLFWKTFKGIHLKNSNNLLDQALKIDSNYVDALQAKAVVIGRLSNDPDSMNYWVDKVLKIDPDHPQANYGKAEYYRQTGKFDLAITHYQKSLQFNPDNRRGNLNRTVDLWLGMIYCLQKRDVRKGYPYLMKTMGLIDGPPGYYLARLAKTFSALGEYEKAELYLKTYMKSGHNDCEALLAYHRFLMTIGNYDRALHLTDSICPLDDCDWQCNDQPITLYAYRNEFSIAEQYIKKWEDQRGKQVFTISKGYVYHKLGRIKEAEEVFQEILKRHAQRLSNTRKPPDVNDFFWRAQILAFQNRKSEALQSIKMIDEMGFNFNLFDRMTHNPMFENLWDDPEFKAILKKVQEEKASVQAQIREMEEQAKFDM